MLDSMRFRVELPDEDERPLRLLAGRDGKDFKGQAGDLLHLKVQEEFALFVRALISEQDPEAVSEVA